MNYLLSDKGSQQQMLLGRMSTNFETNFQTLCDLEDKDDSKGEEMSCAAILIYLFQIFWFIDLVQIISSGLESGNVS